MNQVSEEVAIEQTARLRKSPHPYPPPQGGRVRVGVRLWVTGMIEENGVYTPSWHRQGESFKGYALKLSQPTVCSQGIFNAIQEEFSRNL